MYSANESSTYMTSVGKGGGRGPSKRSRTSTFFSSRGPCFLIEIDPDHNSLPNGIEKQYKNYTSLALYKTFSIQDNVSGLHTSICSSEHKLNGFSYFICISETWATKHNDHLLNISNYNHVQCIRSNK